MGYIFELYHGAIVAGYLRELLHRAMVLGYIFELWSEFFDEDFLSLADGAGIGSWFT